MKKRRRVKQTKSLNQRIAEEADRLRKAADGLPPGGKRDELISKVRGAETALQMQSWLTQRRKKMPT